VDTRDERLCLTAIQSEAARCLDCGEPACRGACPLHNRIPEWLALAAMGEIEQAAQLMHATKPLPELCGALCPQDRLCEGACARVKQGQAAVAIGAVEHAVTEEAFTRGWRPQLAPGQRLDKRAAVIGAGPAGLAFAEAMNRAGWNVTVLDRAHEVGGMLADGLPPFRFDKRALARRRTLLQQAGIRFELGVEVDAKAFLDLRDRHEAVFLGLGARKARDVPLPGRELGGVQDALDYLAQINAASGQRSVAGKHVLVLGGGDTAMDCARAAVRDGAAEVIVAYRGSPDRLRGNRHECAAAAAEGVQFRFLHAPLAIEGEAAVRAVRFALGEGETTTVESIACDLVILAFGQQAAAPNWLEDCGVETEYGAVRVDAHGRSSHPRVFAGGDCAHGPDLIVTAAAAGRRAARTVLAQGRLRHWRAWRTAPKPVPALRRAA
jgi:glutamate synthase (NADPH/NADH) small chain